MTQDDFEFVVRCVLIVVVLAFVAAGLSDMAYMRHMRRLYRDEGAK